MFVKFTSEVVKQYAMGMLLSLSIGCLVGDAVLYLIPEVRNNTNYEMVVSKWKKRKQTTTHYCKIFKMKLKNLKNRGKPIPLTYIFKWPLTLLDWFMTFCGVVKLAFIYFWQWHCTQKWVTHISLVYMYIFLTGTLCRKMNDSHNMYFNYYV